MAQTQSIAPLALNKKLLASAILTATLTACGGGGGGDGGNPAPSGPSFSLNNAQTISENSDTAVDLGTISADDAAPGSKDYAFSVKAGTSTNFNVTNNTLRFVGGTTFDYEANQTVNVVIEGIATIAGADGAEPTTETYERTITVAITDVDEAPTAIILSNSAAVFDEQGAAVGNLETVDPDGNGSPFQQNTFSVVSANAANFVINGSALRLADNYSLAEGDEVEVTIRAQNSAQGPAFEDSFTITTAEATPVGPLVPRSANNFYPVLPGLIIAASTDVAENSEDVQVMFGELDSDTNAYPLNMQISVPIFEDENDSAPSTTETDIASVEEHLVSTPASDSEALGVLTVKKYVVEVPEAIAKLGTSLNPAMTITVDPSEAVDIFKQELVTATLSGQSVQLTDKKATVTLFAPLPFPYPDVNATEELDYSGYIYIEKQSGDDALLPVDIDPEQAERTTYLVTLVMDIDLSPLANLASILNVTLPDTVSINSNMVLAEGLGFTSRSLSVADTGNNLSITGAFTRADVGTISTGSADGDGDFWLNSVDQYPSEVKFH